MKKLIIILALTPTMAQAKFFQPQSSCKPVTVCDQRGNCQTLTVCN